MKDDPKLLEHLLRLDGRALRYASRRMRGDRYAWDGMGFKKDGSFETWKLVRVYLAGGLEHFFVP